MDLCFSAVLPVFHSFSVFSKHVTSVTGDLITVACGKAFWRCEEVVWVHLCYKLKFRSCGVAGFLMIAVECSFIC